MRCKRRENCVARFNIFCERSHVPVTHVPSAAIPKSFPRNVPQVSTLIDNFARMELGTLLFVFYYMEVCVYHPYLLLNNISGNKGSVFGGTRTEELVLAFSYKISHVVPKS